MVTAESKSAAVGQIKFNTKDDDNVSIKKG